MCVHVHVKYQPLEDKRLKSSLLWKLKKTNEAKEREKKEKKK